jgi:hypothetical protein
MFEAPIVPKQLGDKLVGNKILTATVFLFKIGSKNQTVKLSFEEL